MKCFIVKSALKCKIKGINFAKTSVTASLLLFLIHTYTLVQEEPQYYIIVYIYNTLLNAESLINPHLPLHLPHEIT